MAQPRPVTILPGTLIWVGEHWIAYLREPGASSDSAMVSLYQTRYSPAGEGTVAFVKIAGNNGFEAVCTDSRPLASFIGEKLLRKGASPFAADLPVWDARLTRDGDIRNSPSWAIQTSEHRLVTTWSDIEPPVIAEGSFREGTEHFTLLFFAAASVCLDGRDLPGKPYPRDIWKKSIGGDRSSCVFALAETFMEVN